MSERYVIPSVDRAFQVLRLMAGERRGVTLAELGRMSGIPKSTLFRILVTLQQQQCVQWNEEEGRYRLGYRLWELGGGFLDQCEPYRAAERHMKKLAESTGETVFLAKLEDGIVIYPRRVDGTRAVAMMRNLGQRTPADCTASGRAILAFLPDEEVDAILETHSMRSYTGKTVTDHTVLKERLADVRSQGYAVVDGEYHEDLLCISAPVFDHSEHPCASLTLAMLSSRANEAGWMHEYVELLLQETQAFSRDMGYLALVTA